MNSIKHYSILLLIVLSIAGCNTNAERSAEGVAIAFFDAIYNQNNLKEAALLCTPQFSKKLSKYVTTKNIARRMLNMSFDSVKIDAGLGDINVRQEFNNTGSLTILFTGTRQGKIYKELKRIKLIKKGDSWFVDKLLKDPISS